MRRSLLLTATLLFTPLASGQSATIGFVNIDAIVTNMPEMSGIHAELAAFQQRMSSQLNARRNEIESKRQDLRRLREGPGAIDQVVEDLESEIASMESNLQSLLAQAEQAFAAQRTQRLTPVYQRVQAAIEAVRAEQGYSLILNTQVGAGSVVLAGNPADNITEAVCAKLGVPMPASIGRGIPVATAPASGGQ